uniref:putative plastid division protein n=1 Tax=Halimeda opuntia TaxID=118223 RepID=UPI002113D544|nr:putative plastid division protein [Halimeda opuntia]UTN43234.1 putative plastid division protein [Halimeda opuntia]
MQLKFLLIFNDLYQPFFKLGNKTAKQITNLPIFLSFFVMALSVLQISFETRNYSVLKNYPHFTNPQIINKFETLYLQFHDTHEERKIALTQKKKQAKSQLIQEHDENEKLFIDFYKYLKTSTPSYPTIFHQIQSSILKEDTINLYKSFEQIAPILVSEIKKEFDQKNQIEQVEVEPIQHLQIDFPYKNWTTQNETFNEKKEKLLISWEFDNSDIVIKDLKKEKHLLYTPFKPYLAYPKIHESMTKLQRYFYFKSHDKTIVPEAKKARGLKKHEFSENQWQRPEKPFDSFYKKQWKRHKKLFHSLQARLPLPYESINWLDPLKSDYFNQIKKINDQIPRKIEGFQELNSQQLKPCPFIFRKSGHQYQKRKVIKVHFNKQKWNNLVSKINNLVVEYPPSKLWEVCTAPTYKIDKVALYPWKYRKNYGIGYLKPSKDSKQKLLFDFLKLLVDHLNVKYYAQIVHVLKQVQYDNIKHFAKFDVEWVEFLGEGPRALERKRRYFQVGEGINPKTIYQKELGFKLKSIEDRKTERYVNKVAPLKRDPLIFPLYKFQRQEGKYVLPSSESDYFSSIINPYAFFLDEEGEHDLDADVNFQKWREKKNTETFDFYLNNSSPLLKFKNENSYLDELIYAEDYLLETISDILKRNNLNSDFIEFLIGIEFEEEDTEEESEEDEEFEEEEETGASAATSLTFDFIKNRKKQRRLFFQNNQNLVEMKDIFKQKRKLDFSFLYEMFLPNFKLFEDLVLYELHRFNKKNKKNEKNELPAIYQFLQRRQMSGYLFPDLENWPSQRKPQKNLAPLSQKNLPISTDRLQARSFRYQAHSIEGRQFFEFREKINNYSWSLLFFFSSGWVFVNIFKNVYKKYAKEIVESGIDFLERAGILDDVKWLKEELGMSNEQAYRGIRHQGKKFKNIIGLERKYIILQLSEMVWFLKTQKFRFLNFFQRQVPPYLKPKGFLFIGPPGTGKTLLVQALAGETGVPVVTQSGGLLQNPRLRGKGAQTLHKLFLRAREIAPCIIFIDEVDGIGSRRQFLPDGQGGYDAIEFLENHLHLPPPNIEKKVQRRFEFFDDSDPYWKEPEFTQTVQSTPIPIDVLQDMQSSRSARNEQVSILTQLLIELDGLHPLDNILVIGATNRVEILDPALMRPGRFQRILKFNLPDYNARINLLKLYTQSSKIGIEDISWDYFSKRTQGLSSADIASIVFSSELTAIQLGQKHTFASLERGIDLITSFPSDPVMLRLQHIFVFLENSICKFFAKNQFYFSSSSLVSVKGREISALQEISNILRNCYYNIGKMFIVFCLQLQPLASINLWERPKNFRFLFFTQKFNEFDEFEKKRFSRIEIEKRLLAFFGGKAGESLFIFLPLHKFSPEIFFQFDSTFLSFANSLEQSNFGIENEIQRAQSLLKLMVEKWYFYLEKIATEKFHPILEDVNLWEYREKEILLAQALVDEMIIDLDMRHRLSRNEQKHSYQAWWMKKVATQLNFSVQMGIGNEVDNLLWSRIYLSDPDNSAQNIEWVAPDEFFHTLLRTPPFCMPWTQFLENGRFAISNLLLLQSFNTVFKTLRQFPEFIDFLADYFLRQKSIRETVFQAKISQFFDGQI